MNKCQFTLNDQVIINRIGIVGEVTGVSVYKERPPLVYVEYVTKLGDLGASWFNEGEIQLNDAH